MTPPTANSTSLNAQLCLPFKAAEHCCLRASATRKNQTLAVPGKAESFRLHHRWILWPCPQTQKPHTSNPAPPRKLQVPTRRI